MGRADDC